MLTLASLTVVQLDEGGGSEHCVQIASGKLGGGGERRDVALGTRGSRGRVEKQVTEG